MKLLFDQNISFRVLTIIESTFPEAKQVKNVGLENFKDAAIWEYAKENDYCIVTFDADFAEIASFKGCPPKIIWLRIGNSSTLNISNKLINNLSSIKLFLTARAQHNIPVLEVH